MELFDLPEDVFYRYIWPLLDFNDLLRVRRVSKHANTLIRSYTLARPDLTHELEINEDDRKMEDFLQLKLSCQKIYLNNNMTGSNYFATNGSEIIIQSFLNDHGSQVQELRVNKFCQFLVGAERHFYNKLPNLKSLKVENWTGFNSHCRTYEKKELDKLVPIFANDINYYDDEEYFFPDSFKNLTHVDFNMENFMLDVDCMINLTFCIIEAVNFFDNAHYLSVPFNWELDVSHMVFDNTIHPQIDGRHNLILRKFLCNLFTKIKERKEANSQLLRSYSFEHFYLNDNDRDNVSESEKFASSAISYLCEICVEFGISLEMVNAYWFQVVMLHVCQNPTITTRMLGHCVTSLVNIHPIVLECMDFPNLEKIVIMRTSRCGMWDSVGPEWPRLKTLEVTVDSLQMDKTTRYDPGETPVQFRKTEYSAFPTKCLFDLFFDTKLPRYALTHLAIKFDIAHLEKNAIIPRNLAKQIVKSCPNITKIKLVNWPGTNKSISKLWDGLVLLEEIVIDTCPKLGNNAFVGKDEEKPVFPKLKCLKKLELLHLDKMPNITDTFFKLVLSKMKITHLTITSDVPLKSITKYGISALLDGPFATSIEKFTFAKWSLEDSSQKDLQTLASKFRSFYMV